MGASQRPLVIAHRGASKQCPENTFAAFDAAVASGADAMELDAQLSRDGVAVVYHDQTLAKIRGGRHRIAQLDLAQLRRLDFGGWFGPGFTGQQIPLVDELLVRYAGSIELMLELKVDGADVVRREQLAHSVVDLVREHGVQERVWILSFDPLALAAARRRAPELRYVLNVDKAPEPDRLDSSLGEFGALCLPGREVTGPLVERAQGLNRDVFTYRCDTARTVKRALLAGVRGLMADDPVWLRQLASQLLAP